MSDIVKRLRSYALGDLRDIERKGLIKAVDEIEQLRNAVQNRNGLINRLKHELQSIEYALSDARINNTMSAADVAHEMRCELDTLRAELDALKSHTVDCIGIALELEERAKTVESQTTERAMVAAANALRLLAAPKPGERDDPR